jgi:hypothetical protein
LGCLFWLIAPNAFADGDPLNNAVNGYLWLVGILVVVAILIVVVKSVSGISNRVATFDDSRFSQAGVTVNMVGKTIEIKGTTYPIASVRGLRWENTKLKGSTGSIGRDFAHSFSLAFIEVDDFNKPVYKIELAGTGAAETFVSRLALAIEKAGGAKFS